MSRETSLVETVADQVALPPEKVLNVFEHSFRELHRRMYEYDGMNGDYLCEELVHELPETVWIHLYLFLVLYQIKYSSDHPEDVMSESITQLQYLGESDWWQPYVDQTKEWKMSRHLRNLLSHDVER